MIIGFHAAFLGAACLIAAMGMLIAPSENEIAADRRTYEVEREKSLWHGFWFGLGHVLSYRSRGLGLLISHWPERPEGRKFTYAGTAFIAVAVLIGFHFGIFDS